MHCPKCGQEQIAEETRFCSRCGFLLTGVAQLVATGGALPSGPVAVRTKSSPSPRRRGVMKGVFIFLLGFLVVPLAAVFSLVTNTEPVLALVAAILFSMGAVLRVAYALMFESPETSAIAGELPNNVVCAPSPDALPAGTSIPAAGYTPPSTGMWRDTNDLVKEPGSVTDNTTKLLERETDRQ
jgi:hypothetical protein